MREVNQQEYEEARRKVLLQAGAVNCNAILNDKHGTLDHSEFGVSRMTPCQVVYSSVRIYTETEIKTTLYAKSVAFVESETPETNWQYKFYIDDDAVPS